MEKIFQKNNHRFFLMAGLFLIVFAIVLQSCKKESLNTSLQGQLKPEHTLLNNFEQVNLVANNSNYGAAMIDPNLINGWGIAFAPAASGPAWVSAADAGVSVIYNSSTGATLRPPVSIPTNDAATGGAPTGQVFNSTTGFKLSNGNPARFIFAGEDGVISAWNAGNAAEAAINNSNASYKGITIGMNGTTPYLYAANFKQNRIDVWDTLWHPVNLPFSDVSVPANYTPFNVQNIDGKIYVVYAKRLNGGDEETQGVGTGIINVFNPDGTFLRNFTKHGVLNAPWGITAAPASFWGSSASAQKTILVGNFGNGYINAFSESGSYLGTLSNNNKPIEIEGLWGLSFAPAAATSVNPNWLFFAAGPADEEDGLFGYIKPGAPITP